MELPREQQKFSKITDVIREVRKDELSPGIRSYLENIEAQMQEIVEKVGAKDEKDIINRGRTGELFISTDDLRRLTSLAQEKVHITETGKRPGFAEKLEEITNETKTYQGPITPEVIAKLPKSIEHIFTPEGEDLIINLEIGGKTKDELRQELKKKRVTCIGDATLMMERPFFHIEPRSKRLKLIKLQAEDLGFLLYWEEAGDLDLLVNPPLWEDILDRALQTGLELCPPEAGIYLSLSEEKNTVTLGMQPESDRVIVIQSSPGDIAQKYLEMKSVLPNASLDTLVIGTMVFVLPS